MSGHPAFELIREEDLVAQGLAKRGRSNCVLASDNLASLGISLRPVDVALRDTMSRYAAVFNRGS